jgi:hypothetical protein
MLRALLVALVAIPACAVEVAGSDGAPLPFNCRDADAVCPDDGRAVDCDIVSGGTQPSGCRSREPAKDGVALLCCD